jgi:hypothetical protein
LNQWIDEDKEVEADRVNKKHVVDLNLSGHLV